MDEIVRSTRGSSENAARLHTREDTPSVHSATTLLLRLAESIPAIPERRPPNVKEQPDIQELENVLNAIRSFPMVGSQLELTDLISGCMRVAEWAEHLDHRQTASQFLDAAIRLDPVHNKAQEAERRGEVEESERLYLQVVGSATQSQNWRQLARVWIELGRLYRQRGKRLAEAEQAQGKALSLARSFGFGLQEAQALHNLAVIAFDREDSELGLRYARQALDAYAAYPEGIRVLANDLAWYWMSTAGAYEQVLAIFEAVLRNTVDPLKRVDMAGNIARAAAGVGDREKFAAAKAQVWDYDSTIEHGQRVAGALLEVAQGAMMLRDWNEARRAATRAKHLAEQQNESQYVADAAKILRQLRTRNSTAAADQKPDSQIMVYNRTELVNRLLTLLNAKSPRLSAV